MQSLSMQTGREKWKKKTNYVKKTGTTCTQANKYRKTNVTVTIDADSIRAWPSEPILRQPVDCTGRPAQDGISSPSGDASTSA